MSEMVKIVTDEIIWTVHLILRFKLLHTAEYLASPTVAHPKGEEDDWRGFSVNMYVATHIALFPHSSQSDWQTETSLCASVVEVLATSTCTTLSHG